MYVNAHIFRKRGHKMEKIKAEAYAAAKEIIEKAGLKAGNILVVGCSTSEVIGNTIGTNSSPETADYIYIYRSSRSG